MSLGEADDDGQSFLNAKRLRGLEKCLLTLARALKMGNAQSFPVTFQ